MTIRVVLADDQAPLRATFRLLLESVPGIEVVGEAPTGDEAVAAARRHKPDLVARLGISPATAKTHVNRAMLKTDARDRTQLVIFAYENRLVVPGADLTN